MTLGKYVYIEYIVHMIKRFNIFVSTSVDTSFGWLYGQNTLDTPFDESIEALSQIDEKLWG